MGSERYEGILKTILNSVGISREFNKKENVDGIWELGMAEAMNGAAFRNEHYDCDQEGLKTIFTRSSNGRKDRVIVTKGIDGAQTAEFGWGDWDHIEVSKKDYERSRWFRRALSQKDNRIRTYLMSNDEPGKVEKVLYDNLEG